MKAQETTVAMVAAYLFPTMGLNPFVISLLALKMYAFEVIENLSRSGIRVRWNFVGKPVKSLNSETKSSSSSNQLGCVGFLVWLGFLFGCWFLIGFSDSSFVNFFSTWGCELCVSFLVVILVVLFLGVLNLPRSEVFFMENELGLAKFVALDVELSILILEVELSFLNPNLDKTLDASLVELVALVSLVWFLLDRLDLMSLVWFFEDKLGLLSLIWSLVDRLLVFFLGGSSVSSSNNFLLPKNCLLGS